MSYRHRRNVKSLLLAFFVRVLNELRLEMKYKIT